MEPVQRALLHQTAVSVTQLEMQLIPFIRPHLVNANVSVGSNVWPPFEKIHSTKNGYTEYIIAAFCHNNCASSVGFGCDTCKTGFMSPPECCQCEPGREEVNGICSKL